MKNLTWLIGCGYMAQEYFKVLDKLNNKTKVIGRGPESAQNFFKKTNVKPSTSGISEFLKTKPEKCSHAIIAVSVDQLYDTTMSLLEYEVKNLLVEKPAGLNQNEIHKIQLRASEKNANVYVAYNRRFYSSTIKAKEFIKKDGGIQSFNFEFTEWSHQVEDLEIPDKVKNNWFLANSSHVLDLSFFLGGKPTKMSCYASGEKKLNWHPSYSKFSGAGITDSGALFSYNANWCAPGRWFVEMLTNKNRYIFKPLEELKVQKIGSIKIDVVKLDDEIDKKFKPGLFRQTESFLGNCENLLRIDEHLALVKKYLKIIN